MEKGGFEMANQVLVAESNYSYGDSPLETGALDYGNSLGITKQDLKDVEPIINYSEIMGMVNMAMESALSETLGRPFKFNA
jgi:hypothetical protein